jgi:hypothetical protein
MKRITRAVAVAVLAIATGATGTTLATAGPAAGRATIIRESERVPVSESGLTDDCRPGITGEINGIAIITTQSVETDTGFHIHGTIDGPGRIDWSDGSYTLIESVDHFSFNAVGTGTNKFSETHVDSGDFYSADGVFLFRNTFHEVEHFTESNGVVRVDFAKGHFHFFGDCT